MFRKINDHNVKQFFYGDPLNSFFEKQLPSLNDDTNTNEYSQIKNNNIAVFIFICLNICINIITCALINYIMPGADSTKKNKELGLFSDVLFTPISIWDLAKEIIFLINTNNINSEILHQ